MKNKFLLYCLSITLFTSISCKLEKSTNGAHANHAATTDAPAKKSLSPRKAAMTMLDGNHIHIDYGSPSVRGRVIWGGLVAYNQVWATGAHNATSIEFSNDVKINGQTIPKGKYAFFTIPGETEWTLILNKNYDQHLADEYNEKEDVIRMKVKPELLPILQESLAYKVEPINDKEARISMTWEKVQVGFEVENL